MILKRYVTGSLVGPFLLGFGIVTFLFAMEMLLDLLDLLLNKGIDPWTVGRLFIFALGWIVALSVPCGVLVAALMTYGRMSQDNEIIALRASGIHLMTIFSPALGLSVIVAVALALFNNYILPETNYAYASLLQEVSRKRPTAQIREGVMISDFPGYGLWIGRLDDRTGAMKDVLILDGRSRPQAPRTILARSGTLRLHPEDNTLTLELHEGEIHEADPHSPDGEYRRLHFEDQTMNIVNTSEAFGGTTHHQRGQREMSVSDMNAQIRNLSMEGAREDSLLQGALAQIPLKSVDDLNSADPTGTHARKGMAFLAPLVRLFVGKPAPAPARHWTPEQQRAIETARLHLNERESTNRRISEYRVEIEKKFSIPVACVVFVLVGAPLGIMARRGGLAAGFFSLVFFVFYYLCLIGGEQLADRRFLSPWTAMWLPNMILGALGIYLTVRAIISGQPGRRTVKAGPA